MASSEILASVVAITIPEICTGELEMINYISSYYRGRGKSSVYPKKNFFLFEYQCSTPLSPLLCTHRIVRHVLCNNKDIFVMRYLQCPTHYSKKVFSLTIVLDIICQNPGLHICIQHHLNKLIPESTAA